MLSLLVKRAFSSTTRAAAVANPGFENNSRFAGEALVKVPIPDHVTDWQATALYQAAQRGSSSVCSVLTRLWLLAAGLGTRFLSAPCFLHFHLKGSGRPSGCLRTSAGSTKRMATSVTSRLGETCPSRVSTLTSG